MEVTDAPVDPPSTMSFSQWIEQDHDDFGLSSDTGLVSPPLSNGLVMDPLAMDDVELSVQPQFDPTIPRQSPPQAVVQSHAFPDILSMAAPIVPSAFEPALTPLMPPNMSPFLHGDMLESAVMAGNPAAPPPDLYHSDRYA